MAESLADDAVLAMTPLLDLTAHLAHAQVAEPVPPILASPNPDYDTQESLSGSVLCAGGRVEHGAVLAVDHGRFDNEA